MIRPLFPLLILLFTSCESSSDKVKKIDEKIEHLKEEKSIHEKKALSDDVKSQEQMLGNFHESVIRAEDSEREKEEAFSLEKEIETLEKEKAHELNPSH